MHRRQHVAGIAVEAHIGGVVADIQHHLPGNGGNVHLRGGGDFAHDHHHAGGGAGFAGHAGHGILSQDRVQHRVGYLVAQLVGMAFGDGFGSKEFAHGAAPFGRRGIFRLEKVTPPGLHTDTGGDQSSGIVLICQRCPLQGRVLRCGNWHLVLPDGGRLPWLHRARPSATRDKGIYFSRQSSYHR